MSGKIGNSLDRILLNSDKADLLEQMAKALKTMDKAVVVFVQDKEDGGCSSLVFTLGLVTTYEALGVLEVAKSDILAGEG